MTINEELLPKKILGRKAFTKHYYVEELAFVEHGTTYICQIDLDFSEFNFTNVPSIYYSVQLSENNVNANGLGRVTNTNATIFFVRGKSGTFKYIDIDLLILSND